jgi:hypothetical protein
VWRNPSSDWRLFVLLVPLASRLSLMRNPIFAALVRDWGLSVRFVGIDAHARVFDFRRLLSDATLRRLVDALTVSLARPPGHANEALDVLFAALADSMLTILEERRPDWPSHLARSLRLETNAPDSLFDRQARYPDLPREPARRAEGRHDRRGALRPRDPRDRPARGERRAPRGLADRVDAGRGHARRAQEAAHRAAPGLLQLGGRLPAARAQRLYALSRLPSLAQAFIDAIDHPELSRALDSGQDRAIVSALAGRFQRQREHGARRLAPTARGAGRAAHLALAHILQRLDALAQRDWPRDAPAWQEFAQRAVPG